MHEHTTRRWPLRLAQLSPLIAIALLAAIWFSVPPLISTMLANTSGAGGASTRTMRTQVFDMVAEDSEAQALGLSGPEPSFQTATDSAWMNWVDSLGSRPTTASVFATGALSADATEFAPVADWARAHDARVWAWVVPRPARPDLVASATPNAAALVRVQAQAEQLAASLGGDYSTPADYLQYLWDDGQATNVQSPPLNLAMLGVGSGGGTGSEDLSVTNYTLLGAGRLYSAYVAATVDPSGMEPGPIVDEIATLDVSAPTFRADIARIAKLKNVDIWVLGPLDMTATPLLLPDGATTGDARTLGAAIWPSVAIAPAGSVSPAARPLSADVAALAGGPAASVQIASINSSAYFMSTPPSQPSTDTITPQTVAFLAVWNHAPAAAGPLESAWHRWQRFAAGWFPFLLGGAMGLLGLTLVAAPAAFVYERRLIARERVRDEMARMRRDVHDKVYNRLSALSKRVATSGDELSASNAVALGAIAEDIRSTVGELQEILGDEVRHTSGALTSVPLAEQIASVCAAAAARHDIRVDCIADDQLPAADARLGWDLQCIAEEAIANAVRHGAATHVRVQLAVADGALALTVADDGGGSAVFSASQAAEESTGLRGITERLARHGGTLRIAAGEGGGTVLVATVPLGIGS